MTLIRYNRRRVIRSGTVVKGTTEVELQERQ